MRIYYEWDPDRRSDEERLSDFVARVWRLTLWIAVLLAVGGLAALL